MPTSRAKTRPTSTLLSNVRGFFLCHTGATSGYKHNGRLDSSSDSDPWLSTTNITLVFENLADGPHTLTVRAREAEGEGGSSDKVRKEFLGEGRYLRRTRSSVLAYVVSRYKKPRARVTIVARVWHLGIHHPFLPYGLLICVFVYIRKLGLFLLLFSTNQCKRATVSTAGNVVEKVGAGLHGTVFGVPR